MPGSILYESSGTGVLLSWQGQCSGDQLKQLRAQVIAADTEHRLHYQIWDFSDADELEMSSGTARELALQDHNASRFNPEQRVAIVGSELVLNGHDRLYQIYSAVWSGFVSATFATLAEAREWLAEEGTGRPSAGAAPSPVAGNAGHA